MKATRKIIFHGKIHDLSERERDSSKAARELVTRNKRSKVKLFFEGYCSGQEIPPERKKKLAFEPTPIEKREILDFEILVSIAEIINNEGIKKKIPQLMQRGERERKYCQIIQETEDELEERNLKHVLLNFGKVSAEEITDFSRALEEKGYVIQPVLRRIIRSKLDQIKKEEVIALCQDLEEFFQRNGLGHFAGPNLDYQRIHRELRFIEPKGEADPIKVAFMLDDALDQAQRIREAQIVKSILETDFDIGILNIGVGHIKTGRIERWLREKGVETEKDPKTNRFEYELKEYFERNKTKGEELEKLRREFYQDLV